MRLLQGRPLAESVNARTRIRVAALLARKIQPRLDVVSVGIDPAASAYQDRLRRSGEQLGIDVRAVALAPGAVEDEVASKLRMSSADRSVHGILLLTPLPAPLDEARCRCGARPPSWSDEAASSGVRQRRSSSRRTRRS